MSKTPKAKPGAGKSGKRRQELRRTLPKAAFDFRSLLSRPEFVNTAGVLVAVLLVASVVVIWCREEVKVRVGQVMTESRLVRLDYSIEDDQATEADREEARKSAPQVWSLNTSYLDRLQGALNGLPIAVEGKQSISELSEEIRQSFMISDAGLVELQAFSREGQTTGEWKSWANGLIRELRLNPLLASDDYQNSWAPREYSSRLKRLMRTESGDHMEIRGSAIELPIEADEELDRKLTKLVGNAGFPAAINVHITSRLTEDRQPTLSFDAEESTRMAEEAARVVQPRYVEYRQGDVIYRRGDVLTTAQYDEVLTERAMFFDRASGAQIWLPRLGVVGVIAVLMSLLGMFTLGVYPAVTSNALRISAVGVLLSGMVAAATIITVTAPSFMYAISVATALFIAILMLLAYDRRFAVFVSATYCALLTVGLGESVAFMVFLTAGCGVIVALLRDVRQRSSVVGAATVTAAALGIGAVLINMAQIPLSDGAWKEIALNSVWSITASFGVGFLVLGILPSIEKLFGITTGMTLAELRDPKQPLLRQLQQKAPGTYNHSLQVANLAEAASEAIGGDGLLVYVGALYHDIGKINKPEYFVENQADGYNKHTKLSPAMSLLVVVGHVKDGIELAREYGLPKPIQHFIEAHHGTTLVEYFYHAAKTQAEEDEKAPVDEIEFSTLR